ncbi:uncharacterized protein LOC125226777 [Leguminivora glycinivorella]|uniref:uncharacterized protein LOC125226777 n=1 Tax=Leguminivora glycinivorella TaxID=1035111 RepID=UPI00200BE93E|nr:uncharacterized protein LOC125226777 [Leguminivora glycinivorella]
MITFHRVVAVSALLLLLVATIVCQCRGDAILRSAEKLAVPINEFYCSNLTRGQTWVDWKTRMVELPKQHIDSPDTNIVIDYFVRWPWYLKGIRLTVCNSVGHRPRLSWPPLGYTPVTSSCSTEDSQGALWGWRSSWCNIRAGGLGHKTRVGKA